MDYVELRTTVLVEKEKEDEESMMPFFRRKSTNYDERVRVSEIMRTIAL